MGSFGCKGNANQLHSKIISEYELHLLYFLIDVLFGTFIAFNVVRIGIQKALDGWMRIRYGKRPVISYLLSQFVLQEQAEDFQFV